MKNPFEKYATYSRPTDFGIHWIGAHLAERALKEGETVELYYNAGSIRSTLSIEEFIAELKGLGGHLFRHVIPSRHDNEEWCFIWEKAGVSFEYFPKNKGITFIVRSNDPELSKAFKALSERYITRQKTRGRVYVVTMSQDGPRLTEMGVAGEDFIPGNYHPEVVEDYRHVVKDLNSSDPCGFVTLLNGPPGSGKTHMVRAMMNEVGKATFILVPSNMISALGAPDFMGLLLREQRKDAPMVLFIEDADEAIVDRKDGNKSAISALLNFSDGIFGALLNIRIVCTTNVKIAALDGAVMRKGRLCRDIHVGLLSATQANEIYKRLTGKEGEYKGNKMHLLADIYDDAKNTGRVERETKPSTPKVGFELPSKEEALEVFAPEGTDKDFTMDHYKDFNGKLVKIGTVDGSNVVDAEGHYVAGAAPVECEKTPELPTIPEVDDDSDLIDEDPLDDDEPDWIEELDDDDAEYELTPDHYHDTNPGDDW